MENRNSVGDREPSSAAAERLQPAKRSGKRVSFEAMQTYLDEYGATPHDVESSLGLSRGTIRIWQRRRNMPAWALIAVEGLRRRPQHQDQVVWLVKPGTKAQLVGDFLNALGITPVAIP